MTERLTAPPDSAYRGLEASRNREMLCTVAGTEAFSILLRTKFDNIKFVVDPTAAIVGDLRLTRLADGSPINPFRQADSLPMSSETKCRCWIEPPGWQPEWVSFNVWSQHEPRVMLPRWRVRNQPNRYFDVDINEPFGKPGAPVVMSMWAVFPAADKAELSFLAAVFRMVAKFAMHEFDAVYDDTGRVRRANVCQGWVGPDAVAWCAANAERRLWRSCRPLGAPPASPLPAKYWRADNCENPALAPDFQRSQGQLHAKFVRGHGQPRRPTPTKPDKTQQNPTPAKVGFSSG